MDTIEKILGEFMELVQSISFPNGGYRITMNFGDQIKPIADKSNKVKITPCQNGLCIYEIAKGEGMDTLVLFIKKTIDYNIEAKAKSKLYTQKVKELQDIFVEHTIDELSTLRFVIGQNEDAQYADNSVSFESKLSNTAISSVDVIENVPEKKKTSKKQKPENEETVSTDEVELTDNTNASELSDHSEFVSGKVDVKL